MNRAVWHDLEVRIQAEAMSVSIDGALVGEFRSAGIAHPTKSRLRLAVNKSTWVDDVKIVRLTDACRRVTTAGPGR